MTIPFSEIPLTLLVPGVYTETNASRAVSNTPVLPKRLYIVGPRYTAGEVATGVPFRASSDSESDRCAGVGSPLAEMLRVAKNANRFVELWGIGLTDNGSGVAASGTIVYTGPATAAGTLYLYVSPYYVGATLRGKYAIAVTSGMTATQLGDAIVAALAADPYATCTAINTTGSVAFTAKSKGTQGNDIVLSHNLVAGERFPTGISGAITPMASGATNPTLSTALSAIGDVHVTHLAEAWTDSTNLTSLESELVTRWGGTVQLEMHGFIGVRGSVGTMTTLGNARNSKFCTLIGTGLSPTPSYIVAAELAAVDAGMDHPGQPLRGKLLNSMFAPAQGAAPKADERQSLLTDGVSTFTVGPDGKCYVEREITTYQVDGNGNPDSTFRDRQVAGLLAALRYDTRTYFGTKYPNYMHAADGSKYGPGIPVVTPTTIKNEFKARAKTVWEEGLGWIENSSQLIADLAVERTEEGIDAIVCPDLINRLHLQRYRFDFLR